MWAERKLQDKCLSRESDAKRRRHYLGGCRPAFRVRGTRGISQAVNPPVLGHTCVLALAVVLAAVPGAAQGPSTEKPSTQRPPTEATPPQTEGGTISGTWPGLPVPGVLLPPRVGLDLLYAPPTQGRLAVTPSLTVSEEFNDNIFLSSANRRSDFITQFTPGVALAIKQPDFRIMAGYNFTAEVYARQENLDNAANRQNFVTTAFYEPTPLLTLNLIDAFSYSTNSNAASLSGISSGRQEAWSNVLAPSLDLRLTPRTTGHLFGAYALERFGGQGTQGSDVYRIGTGVDFAVSPRGSVTGGYDFAYLDIKGQPTALVHTPRVGGTYRVTPTATATFSGGPSFVVSERDTTVIPAVTAKLIEVATWGAMSIFYDRAASTAGGFGGPSENQTVGGSVTAAKLWRGVVLDFSPRYTMSKSVGVAPSKIDIEALTLNPSVSYQIARNIAVVTAYTFFNQRTGGATSTVAVDQNRVFIGLRFGYPRPSLLAEQRATVAWYVL